jgi:hypothetical protein
MDELGKLVSTFVKERLDEPCKGEEDIWTEFVCAGLFSVAFHVVLRLSAVRKSPELLQYNVKSIISDTTGHASVWVNQRLSYIHPQIKVVFDDSEHIRARLVAYFNEALFAMGERGYDMEVARSHACFAVFSSALKVFIAKGLLSDSEKAASMLKKGINSFDNMAREIIGVLDKQKN